MYCIHMCYIKWPYTSTDLPCYWSDVYVFYTGLKCDEVSHFAFATAEFLLLCLFHIQIHAAGLFLLSSPTKLYMKM